MTQRARKSQSSRGQRLSSVSRGGGRLGIMKMARIGCTFAYGGRPSAISISVMPSDQMSAFSLYPTS